MGRIEKLKFGVIGVGRIGKIHIENLSHRIPNAEVIVAADVYSEELNNVAKQFSIGSTSSNYKDILNTPDVDAVVICSPTDTHSEIIQEAAALGKHIFCEKPIDLDLDKIAKINDVVDKHGVKFMVGFNRRFDPNFLKVHDTVQQGKIGKPHVLNIISRDPDVPPKEYINASGGIFLDMTIHDFDMARYLIKSEVEEVYTRADVLIDPVFKEAGDYDTAVITLTFENGALGIINNSRKAVYGYDQRVEVFGSDGIVMVNNNTPDNHIHIDCKGTHSSLPLNFFMERYTQSYLNEMQAFIDCIQNDVPSPVTGEDGFMAVIIGLAAKRSAEENRPVKTSEIFNKI
jgi:myo-inositol 2-dehydrogenase/D-chiro-inositol 1-dehydrogenase